MKVIVKTRTQDYYGAYWGKHSLQIASLKSIACPGCGYETICVCYLEE